MKLSRPIVFTSLLALVGSAAFLSGCPFEFESEPQDNTAPTTFFLGEPADTTFLNTMQFSWNGTDEDSDVVAYQTQLVYYENNPNGPPVESVDPPNSDGSEEWSDRTTDDFRLFSELADGHYEMRVRAVDQQGLPDTDPARHRFYVFFDDIFPLVEILFPTQGRLNGVEDIEFHFNASDESRNSTTPREALEYRYQLRAVSLTACTQHLSDQFTEWTKFPPGDNPIVVDEGENGPYNDLFPVNCEWTFTLNVRDPAGNVTTETFDIFQNGRQ